jgi:SAM-dependent methyltransferase
MSMPEAADARNKMGSVALATAIMPGWVDRVRRLVGLLRDTRDGVAANAQVLCDIKQRCDLLEGRIAGLETRLDKLAARPLFDAEHERNMAVISALLNGGLVARQARLRTAAPPAAFSSAYAPVGPQDIDEAFGRLEQLDPVAYPVWRRLFENGRRSYYEQREASCSHRDHWYAKLFGAYIEIYGFGRILDIGCGPHGLPSYLASHEPRLVSGLEPLAPTGRIDFEYVQGFNEFLPWPNGSFHTVVSGTSLDHVLSLERALAEVARVLATGGRYLVWLASIPGAPAYAPSRSPPVPIDDFHLFHFDRKWVEPIFERFFRILDTTVVSQPGFDHVFYCMAPLE